jgi:alpha-tubulin suppressor-like RCC1 family protein
MDISSRSRSGLIAGLLVASSLAALAASCGESAGPPRPAHVLVESGDSQVGAAGQVLGHPLVVRVTGTSGQSVPGVPVSWTVAEGGGALSSNTVVTDAAGQASVAWTLGVIAGPNRVAAIVVGLAPAEFHATSAAGAGARLAFVVQPSNATAATSISPAVRVAVQDAYGNLAPGAADSISVALTAGSGAAGATLSGTLTTAASNGVATFTDLVVTRRGAGYTLTATAASLASAVSGAFAVDAGPASTLAFAVDPSDGTARVGLNPSVIVRVEDAYGNLVSTASDTVTVSVTAGSGTPGASLSGTLSAAALLGRATFDDLVIDSAGVGYTLTAGASGLVPATSGAFRVFPWTPPSVSAGFDHTCGLKPGGVAWCWGPRVSGKQGNGWVWTTYLLPAQVQGGLRFSSLSAGGTDCGISLDGTSYCWGINNNGQLGSDSAVGVAPAPVSGGHDFATIVAADGHSCALTADGTAYCWGFNLFGSLGDGTMVSRSVPTPVAGGLRFRAIAAWSLTTCGVSTAGDGYCWGDNRYGALGTGDPSDSVRTVPMPVAGGLKFETIGVGGAFACGLTTGGAAYCWGHNDGGQVGDGTTLLPRRSPVAVAGGLTFRTITVGGYHACGITLDGAAYCWGWNSSGELGDGTTDSRVTPTPVLGGLVFGTLDAGVEHTCGLTTAGSVYCWGDNGYGEVGDGSVVNRTTPTHVFGFP